MSNANGSTQTTTDTGFDIGTYTLYQVQIHYDAGDRITWTINNNYLGESTTNLPAGTTNAKKIMKVNVQTSENAAKSVFVPGWNYTMYPGWETS